MDGTKQLACPYCGTLVPVSTAICPRCGLNVKEMLPPAERPAPGSVREESPPAGRFAAGRGKARALVGLFVFTMCTTAFILVIDVARISRLSAQAAPLPDGWLVLAALAQLVALLSTGITFLSWFASAHRNLTALGAQQLRYSPGWAVGGWFVPFLNLIRPYQVMSEIWRASDSDDLEGTAWVNAGTAGFVQGWWAVYVLSLVASQWAIHLAPKDAHSPGMVGSLWCEVLAGVLSFWAAGLAIAVVRSVDERQAQRYERLQSAVHPTAADRMQAAS